MASVEAFATARGASAAGFLACRLAREAMGASDKARGARPQPAQPAAQASQPTAEASCTAVRASTYAAEASFLAAKAPGRVTEGPTEERRASLRRSRRLRIGTTLSAGAAVMLRAATTLAEPAAALPRSMRLDYQARSAPG